MRSAILVVSILCSVSVHAQEMSADQKEVWNTLEKQVALDVEQDFDAMRDYMHPKGCYWGNMLPAPVRESEKTGKYYAQLRAHEDEIVAHLLVPVTVIVVDDVAIVNFYGHAVTKDEDGESEEKVMRGHNTWKKHDGRWKLLATYNTTLEDDDD